jgi:hypothetical protein
MPEELLLGQRRVLFDMDLLFGMIKGRIKPCMGYSRNKFISLYPSFIHNCVEPKDKSL